METASEKTKSKGGRPKKKAEQVRKHKFTVFLSEGEMKVLQEMMEKTGKTEAELFRHGLFGGTLRIPKARLVSAELLDTLTAFKRLASLHQYLSLKDKDFNPQEKEQLLGSSNSLRIAIERFERSVFLALDRADHLGQLLELIEGISAFKDVLQEKEFNKADLKSLEQWLQKAEQILHSHYTYLKMT